METLTDEQVITLFDELVSEDVIMYGPHTKHHVDAENYPVYPTHQQTAFHPTDSLLRSNSASAPP